MARTGVGPALATLGVAAGAALAWGSLIERRRFTLRRYEVPVLASGAAPIRVLHLSDLHMAPWQRDKQEWVASLADYAPDLIVNTGDNLGHRDGLDGVRRALEPFRGVPGVYVNGSNDYFAPQPKNPLRYFLGPSKTRRDPERLDTAALEGFFGDLGWASLNNAATALSVRGTRLELFGVDDPHRHYDRLELLTGAIDDLREEQDERPATLTVGVAHAPYRRVLGSFLNHGAELMLAGHTHGGQVCVPGLGALVTNCDLPRSRARGLGVWTQGLRSGYLHVSAGVGTSIYAPARFACPPEATLLTLVPVT